MSEVRYCQMNKTTTKRTDTKQFKAMQCDVIWAYLHTMRRESKFLLVAPKYLWSSPDRSLCQKLMDVWHLIFSMVSHQDENGPFIFNYSTFNKSPNSLVKLLSHHCY
jgi:hypothetical protein